MKLDFDWQNDGKLHQYCVNCHAESIQRVYEGNKTFYFCTTCREKHERSIVIDPGINWWVDDKNGYWHESAGVFVRNPSGKFLFFERTVFPFALTVPSGHVDKGEEPAKTASRELEEEVGISSRALKAVVTEDIVGDSCRRGADAHRWHAFLLVLKSPLTVSVREEGEKPVWLSLEEALTKDVIFPVRYIVGGHTDELVRPITTK